MHRVWKYPLTSVEMLLVRAARNKALVVDCMVDRVETRSDNARHVILKHGNCLYHVDKVNVEFSESSQMYNAVFRAKRVDGGQLVDLDFDISQKVYEVLVEYTKLDDSDLLLVLQIENNDVKWSFVSESWVRQQSESKTHRYIV